MNTPTFCSVEVFKTNFLHRVRVRRACGVVRTSELVLEGPPHFTPLLLSTSQQIKFFNWQRSLKGKVFLKFIIFIEKKNYKKNGSSLFFLISIKIFKNLRRYERPQNNVTVSLKTDKPRQDDIIVFIFLHPPRLTCMTIATDHKFFSILWA